MKKLSKILSFVLALALALTFVACGDTSESAPSKENFTGITFESQTVNYDGELHEIIVGGNVPEGTSITYSNNKATEEGTYNATATLKKDGYNDKTVNATLKIVPPTPTQVVLARAKTVSQNVQGFDYQYQLKGELSVLGIEGAVEGTYLAQYRENKTTGGIAFKRTTSGELLIDSTKYVYNKGNQLITLKMDDDGKVKKVSNLTVDEQDETFIHRPIEALVNNIGAEEIKNIAISSDVPGYKYKASLQFGANNEYLRKILTAVSFLGTTISFKGVEITNPVNGIEMYFNYEKGGRLEDFFVSFNVTVPIKMASASITLTYQQMGATSTIQIPTVNNFVVENSQVNAKVNVINNAINNLKNDSAYSLDVTASNDFDPSWKINATVDKYVARLYKNTKDSEVYFNHSYEYKAHHETDGAETYKYTLGNVIGDDAGVYLVSRKGTNVVSPVAGEVSVDNQFDYLTSMALINSANVDCIRIIEEDNETTYKVYLNKASVLGIQQKILNIINSNDAEGVLDVNNYFNTSEYVFEEAIIEVKFVDGKLTLINCETQVRYNPIGGEYTEYNVELKNSIKLEINKNLDKAIEYKAPSSTGKIVGIGAAKYYVL